MEQQFALLKSLEVEGFDPNEYARPYEENPEENYLPYEIQRWWFNTVCPNGRIMVSPPEPDAERTPGAYTARVTVWKDKGDNNNIPDICMSARAVPSENGTIDTYQDCQRKAISLALKTLGFWLTPSKVVKKPSVDPEKAGLIEGTPVTEATPATEEAPKKRGRKPRATVDEATTAETPAPADEAPAEEPKSEPATETAPEPAETTAEPMPEPVEEPVDASTPAVEPEPEAEPEKPKSEGLMPLDEARATVISYRNYAGRTIGELADSSNPKDREVLVWFATSARAAGRYEKEVAAAKAVLANEA